MLYIIYNRVVCKVELLAKHSLLKSYSNRS
nr:MAG TPA: hypothetical protein [Bacteriophage sp.]DAH37796.1 MAG TPA: hypothetical protein [Caudoviricetes sp.]